MLYDVMAGIRYEKTLEDLGVKERIPAEEEEKRATVEKAIDAVRDPNERTVLRGRYIHGAKWSEIAAAMHYSERHVLRMHKEAIKHIAL